MAVLGETSHHCPRKADMPANRDVALALLHSPPSSHGINRTTWKMADLQRVLREQGTSLCVHVIREIFQKSGYRWRRARIVLTSNDPEYRAKLDRIHAILAGLQPEERFFSIDEYGPVAVKKRPGLLLVAPEELPTIPQWQKSKGRLIITAALELCTNQVTHFYSERKNTAEMVRMVDVLLQQYHGCRRLYLSWDAASWHASKEFTRYVEHVNDPQYRAQFGTPLVELAPLPTGAQFLNVIESVFSGMAKAVVHNSDYASLDLARAAIDRYFADRNTHFITSPKHAGKKIWGTEPASSVFSESQQCKDWWE